MGEPSPTVADDAVTPAQPPIAADSGAHLSGPAALAAGLWEAESGPLPRPVSTYRLQLHAGFTIEALTGIVPYLSDLGVTDVYMSPHLAARPGSTHGYDVFDHTRLNDEIGSDTQYERLVQELTERGMGRLLDIVPNHMGVGGFNRYWMDVLESGPNARFARFFDIDWSPVKEELADRVLLPILETQYGVALEDGLFRLEREGGEFSIRYRETRLPLSPWSYALVLGQRQDELESGFDADDPEVMEYHSILEAARQIPRRAGADAKAVARARGETEVVKRRIKRLCAIRADLREFIDANIALICGKAGEPGSFDLLHRLLEEQVYRLAFWRVAGEEINYRRFFDINDLAGLRTEDPLVFDAVHALIFQWVDRGGVTGLRIDHPDGLADPLGYFVHLQEQLLLRACRRRFDADGGRSDDWPAVERRLLDRYREALAAAPHSPQARRFPVVAEKILSRGESLPEDWPIDGTVGYEYLNLLNGLFVDPTRSAAVEQVYAAFTGDTTPFVEVVYEAKGLITRNALASEINTLARRLNRISERDRRSRDFTLNNLRLAIREIIACFPVYRTYVRPDQPVSAADRGSIEQAVARARRRNPHFDPSLFDYVRSVLLLDAPSDPAPEVRPARDAFVRKFQQTTGPVQAKGLEDTAFYRQVKLAALNEVGGDPPRFGVSPSSFHAANADRLAHWPHALSTSSTHDTKRGEDARIRIDAISEFADDWAVHLNRWARWNARKKVDRDGSPAPDAREEYLFYQVLLATWPFEGVAGGLMLEYVARLQEFMVKAAREAKINTSWIDQDPSYVELLQKFVSEVLSSPDAAPFLDDFAAFHRRVAALAVPHSLSQALIKFASPGVPDVYQGCELWDFSLVDPDNRRPVDYAHRRELLTRIQDRLAAGESRADLAAALLADPADGAIKLYLTWTLLNHRKGHPDLYQHGQYRPLEADGPRKANILSFARYREGRALLIVAPRLLGSFPADGDRPRLTGPEAWAETRLLLPESTPVPLRWRDLLTDREIEVEAWNDRPTLDLARLLDPLPLAALVNV